MGTRKITKGIRLPAEEVLRTSKEMKKSPVDKKTLPPESAGPKYPEPTRYGDWERNGRCYDF